MSLGIVKSVPFKGFGQLYSTCSIDQVSSSSLLASLVHLTAKSGFPVGWEEWHVEAAEYRAPAVHLTPKRSKVGRGRFTVLTLGKSVDLEQNTLSSNSGLYH